MPKKKFQNDAVFLNQIPEFENVEIPISVGNSENITLRTDSHDLSEDDDVPDPVENFEQVANESESNPVSLRRSKRRNAITRSSSLN